VFRVGRGGGGSGARGGGGVTMLATWWWRHLFILLRQPDFGLTHIGFVAAVVYILGVLVRNVQPWVMTTDSYGSRPDVFLETALRLALAPPQAPGGSLLYNC
jgi:hypothetical protein